MLVLWLIMTGWRPECSLTFCVRMCSCGDQCNYQYGEKCCGCEAQKHREEKVTVAHYKYRPDSAANNQVGPWTNETGQPQASAGVRRRNVRPRCQWLQALVQLQQLYYPLYLCTYHVFSFTLVDYRLRFRADSSIIEVFVQFSIVYSEPSSLTLKTTASPVSDSLLSHFQKPSNSIYKLLYVL